MNTERNEKGQFFNGFTPWNRGKSWSEEWKKKRSEATKGKTSNTGRTHFVKGQVSNRIKPLQVARCEWCGIEFTHKNPPSRVRHFCGLDCQRKSFNTSGHKREYPTAENHPMWKGGYSEERKIDIGRKKTKEWRKAVYERDNYTCQICGERGGRLNADHIKAWAKYPELRYEVSNGRTLCISCHIKTPNYGRKGWV